MQRLRINHMSLEHMGYHDFHKSYSIASQIVQQSFTRGLKSQIWCTIVFDSVTSLARCHEIAGFHLVAISEYLELISYHHTYS